MKLLKTVNKALVSNLLAKAPADIKALVKANFGDANGDGSVTYPAPTNQLMYNWTGQSFSASYLNEIEVADLYFNGIWTWYGEGSPFRFFLTGNHDEECIAEWVRDGSKWQSRESFLVKLLEDESRWYPFLTPLVLDTLNFITTGKRQIPLRLMTEMMLEHSTSLDANKYEPTDETPLIIRPRGNVRTLENLTSQEFFLKWARQPGGIKDIIDTHKMLFGN
jgi:hypothetical protein